MLRYIYTHLEQKMHYALPVCCNNNTAIMYNATICMGSMSGWVNYSCVQGGRGTRCFSHYKYVWEDDPTPQENLRKLYCP